MLWLLLFTHSPWMSEYLDLNMIWKCLTWGVLSHSGAMADPLGVSAHDVILKATLSQSSLVTRKLIVR